VSFSLTILGSSSAIPTSKRFPSAHLLNTDEHFFLIDCGEGTQVQLRRFGIHFGRINHVFISHLHGDHVFGLFGLLSTFNLMGRKTDLHIYADPRLEEIVSAHLRYFDQKMRFKIVYHPIEGNKSARILETKRLTVDTIPLKHSVPCYGFLFREKEKLRNIKKEAIEKYHIPIQEMVNIKRGADFVTEEGEIIPNKKMTLSPLASRSYAYCSDTLALSSVVHLVESVNLLYHEATFLDRDKKIAKETLHTTAVQAAKIAREAGVNHLIIGHFSVRYKSLSDFEQEAKSFFPDVTAAIDGTRYYIESSGKVRISFLSEDSHNDDIPFL